MPNTLSFGSRGPAVVRLQLLLSTRGVAHLDIDGIFGQKTQAAVVQAQRNAGLLPPDGIAGPHTWEALRATRPAHVEVPRVRTQLNQDEVADALLAAHRRVFGVEPPGHRLRMARAHCGLEHGLDGHGIHTFNLGNVMTGRAWHGPWFAMEAREWTKFGWKVRKSNWRASAEPWEGGVRYWGMLTEHFPVALTVFDLGSPEDVAHALKAEPTGSYYSDKEAHYAELMRACWDRLSD